MHSQGNIIFLEQPAFAWLDVDSEINALPADKLRGVDTIVVRVAPTLLVRASDADDAEKDAIKIAIAARIGERTVVAIPAISPKSELHRLGGIRALAPLALTFHASSTQINVLSEQGIDVLAQEELAAVFDEARERALLCADKDHHFCLPSDIHTSAFFRVAEIFAKTNLLDRVAYWVCVRILRRGLEKSVPRCLVVDNPSMLVLAIRVEQLLGCEIVIETLPSYAISPSAEQASASMLRQLRLAHTDVVGLIGVCSTGRTHRLLLGSLTPEESDGAERSIALFTTKNVESLVPLCRISIPEYQHSDKESCSACAQGSVPVRIDPRSYLVSSSTPLELALPPPKFFAHQKIFLTKFGKIPGALRVHYDNPNDGAARHHAFYVDVGSLLADADFRNEVRLRIGKVPRPDLVLAPAHAVGEELLKIAHDVHGSTCLSHPSFVVETPPTGDDAALLRALKLAKSILVLDDVSITGSRLLKEITPFLRTNGVAPNVREITYLPILALCDSRSLYEDIHRGLTTFNPNWKATFDSLYHLILPSWHSTEACPWCAERSVLTRLAQGDPELAINLQPRLAQLQRTRQGLQREWPFQIGDEAVPDLQGGSQVLPEKSSALQVLFACASAIQQARHGSPRLNPAGFPTPSYIAARVFERNYTE